jgi:hypothetical protein
MNCTLLFPDSSIENNNNYKRYNNDINKYLKYINRNNLVFKRVLHNNNNNYYSNLLKYIFNIHYILTFLTYIGAIKKNYLLLNDNDMKNIKIITNPITNCKLKNNPSSLLDFIEL